MEGNRGTGDMMDLKSRYYQGVSQSLIVNICRQRGRRDLAFLEVKVHFTHSTCAPCPVRDVRIMIFLKVSHTYSGRLIGIGSNFQ